jgi:NADPH:quinone reductase-like Zn-dependent oxidoreductase
MRAIRVYEHGGPDVLCEETVPRPEPASDEVLVRVRAAGVNPIDWLVREGYADDAVDPSLPYVPGWDLSGVVADVGTSVSALEPDDEVFGLVGLPETGETYAEYAAAGGVGHLAVQFADRAGAHVVGTASARNEAYLRDLGVDEFVDYRSRRFEAVVDGVDVVLDAVGGDTLDRSVDVLCAGGRLVTLPEPPGDGVVERARNDRDATVHWFSIEPDAAALATVRDRLAAGDVEVTVSDAWPLSEAALAHREIERGHVRGKLVLEVGEAPSE